MLGKEGNTEAKFIDWEAPQNIGEFIGQLRVYETLYDIKSSGVGHVFQRGVGYTNGHHQNTSPRYLATGGIGPCVAMCLYAREPMKSVLIHADHLMNVATVINEANAFLNSRDVDVSVIGGISNNSEPIIHRINNIAILQPGWRLVRADTLGNNGKQRQVILDSWTGEVHDLKGHAQVNLYNHTPWELPDHITARLALPNNPSLPYIMDNYH